MAQLIGHITQINGLFHVRSDDGMLKSLKVGDALLEGESIVGDNSNSPNSVLKFSLEDSNGENFCLI